MIRGMPDWSRCSLRPWPALSLFLKFCIRTLFGCIEFARSAFSTIWLQFCEVSRCWLKWPKICQFQRLGWSPSCTHVNHISRDIKRQLQSKAPKVLNPLAFSCEANESVVGHVSRISRRVSSRTVSGRVLDRICIKTKLLAKKFKAKLRHRRTTRWCRRRKAAEGQSKGSVGIERNL